MSTRTNSGGFIDASLGDQTANDVSGQFLVDVQAHVSEFQADIGVEMIGAMASRILMIELRAVLGFIRMVTFSPRLSMLTLMPARLMACVARTASAICVPATNRPETRRPEKIARRSYVKMDFRKDGRRTLLTCRT